MSTISPHELRQHSSHSRNRTHTADRIGTRALQESLNYDIHNLEACRYHRRMGQSGHRHQAFASEVSYVGTVVWEDCVFGENSRLGISMCKSLGYHRELRRLISTSPLGATPVSGSHTSVIQYPAFCPLLDDHCKRSYALIDLYIGLDHSCVLQCQRVVNIHIACQFQLRVPEFHYWHLGMRHTDDTFHPI